MKSFITKLLSVTVFVITLEVISLFFRANPLIVSPILAVENAIRLIITPGCIAAVLYTSLRILLGFLTALILGTICAILTCKYKWFEFLMAPLVSIVKITPIVSFVIIALVYINNLYIVSFISFLMTFPVFYFNVINGIKSVDKKLIEMAKVYKLREKEIYKNIYIPTIMPNFISAIESGIGFSFKSGITAEVLVLPKHSLGMNLYNSKVYLDTLNMFSYTIIIIFVSLLLEFLIIKILKRGLRYDKTK